MTEVIEACMTPVIIQAQAGGHSVHQLWRPCPDNIHIAALAMTFIKIALSAPMSSTVSPDGMADPC